MKSKIIISLCLLCNVLALAAQDVREEFAQTLAEKTASVRTILCDFTQTRSLSVLQNDAVESGRLVYSRPGNILLAFDNGDYINMTDTRFSMKEDGNTTSVRISSNPMLKELKRVLEACMTADMKLMGSGFNMDVQKTDIGYSVILTPAKGRSSARFKSISMEFDEEYMTLAKLRIEEFSGDSLTYDFSNSRYNAEIPEDLRNPA